MFEQSTLPSVPRSKRLWTTSAGAIGEAVLLVFAMIAPMIWPQALPRTNLITALLPPVPTGRPKPPVDKPPVTPITRVNHEPGPILATPPYVPTHVMTVVDPPPDVASAGPWVDGGTPGVPGAPPSLVDQILRSGSAPAPAPAPRVADAPRPAPAPAAPVEPKRVPVGGRVKMAAIVHRVEIQYPSLARQMRIQGEVQLVGVIGIDGRLKELRLINGHPLLARAAMDAVSQWIYKPTRLNDEPVEVIAPITVTFRLN